MQTRVYSILGTVFRFVGGLIAFPSGLAAGGLMLILFFKLATCWLPIARNNPSGDTGGITLSGVIIATVLLFLVCSVGGVVFYVGNVFRRRSRCQHEAVVSILAEYLDAGNEFGRRYFNDDVDEAYALVESGNASVVRRKYYNI